MEDPRLIGVSGIFLVRIGLLNNLTQYKMSVAPNKLELQIMAKTQGILSF